MMALVGYACGGFHLDLCKAPNLFASSPISFRKVAMKRIALALCFCVAPMFIAFCWSSATARDLVKIDTCWIDESPGFNIWYAQKMGWDREEGLDIVMHLFTSGPAQMEALPAKQWVLGSTGAGGQLTGIIRYDVYSVAATINEGINRLYLRPGHSATQIKGWNPEYPEVYGSPETVRGMKILYTTQTTVHYMIGKWLEVLGLTFDDVTLVNMDQASAVAAFERNIGDAVGLWAPFVLTAERKNWPLAGTGETLKMPTVASYVGDREWCDAHPDLVARFLRVHFRVAQMMRDEGLSPRIVELHRQYMNEFCGIRMTAEESKRDLELHPRWTYDEALAVMVRQGGERSKAEQWQDQIANFFASIGRFSKEEIAKLQSGDNVTDKFLKRVELPITALK